MPGNLKVVSRIALLREKVGLTQLELSRLLGVTETTIQNWERSRAGIEQIERVIKLCEFLECEPEELIEYIPSPNSELAEPQTTGRLEKLRKRLGTEKAARATRTKKTSESKEQEIGEQ